MASRSNQAAGTQAIELAWVPWLLLLVAVGLQVRSGVLALAGDLAQSDPPAHFTTGVMLHDFLKHPFVQPLPFAECFYVQYPKVALGHWPPVFYVVEALWFFLFGSKIVAAEWLCACIAAACALALYRVCARFWGNWHATTLTAVFLAFPLVQTEAWRVMSDLLLTALIFLAIVSFSDYIDSGKKWDALRFAAWSLFAILTKGTAWLLFVPFLAGPLFTARSQVYSRLSYWVSMAVVCAGALPFFLWTSWSHLGYPTRIEGHLLRLSLILSNLSQIQWVAGICVLSVAGAALYWFRPEEAVRPEWALGVLCGLWIISQVMFIVLVPLTPEWNRYLMPSCLPAAFLLAGLAFALERLLARHGRVIAALLCFCAVAGSLRVKHLYSTPAFSRAAASIPLSQDAQIILVDSDPAGEGAIVAARLEQDRLRSSYILRGTKFLSTSEWSGGKYSLRYQDPAALRSAMESNLVDYAVIDKSAPSASTPLLEKVLQEPGWKWDLTNRIPVVMGPRRGDLLVYRRTSPALPGVVRLSVQLGPERGGQTLTCSQPIIRTGTAK